MSSCDYSVDVGSSESFLHGGELPTLIVQSTGHALHIFINGQLSGTQFERLVDNEDLCFELIINKTSSVMQVLHLVQGRTGDSHLKERSTSVLEQIKLHCSVWLLDCRFVEFQLSLLSIASIVA